MLCFASFHLYKRRGAIAVHRRAGRTGMIIYCTALGLSCDYNNILHYCTVLNYPALRCAVQYCTALRCTSLNCTALQFTLLHCTARRKMMPKPPISANRSVPANLPARRVMQYF